MYAVIRNMVAFCEVNRGLILGLAIFAVGAAGVADYAQDSNTAASAKSASFSGCVQKGSGSDNLLVISGATVCATLKGKLAVPGLVGHQVDLKGVLTPRTTSTATSIEVESVDKVGEGCSDVCKLQPPGTRGLRPPPKDHEVPGSEGGTPGVTVKPPK